MKQISFLFFLCLCFVCFLPGKIFAHVLQTDGSIGAVLHINPDDEPIAGKQSSFFFEFKDTQGRFAPESCDCTFSILENKKTIYTQPLFQNNSAPDLQNATALFTFPKKDIYVVRVSGKPTTKTAFQPFTLSYDIRVDKATDTTDSPKNENWLTTFSLVIGFVFLLLIVFFVGRR